MTRAAPLYVASDNPSPKIRRAPKRPPLISSEARKREAEGRPFYERAHLKPSDLPITYRSLTSYPARVERKRWRSPVALGVGVVFGLGVLGATGNLLMACVVGLVVAGGVAASDGWRS